MENYEKVVLYPMYITMALKKEVKRMYWGLPVWDELKAAIAEFIMGL